MMKNRRTWIALGAAVAFLLYLMLVKVADVIVYSIFVYFIARPIYQSLQDRLKSKALSAFISLFILILPVVIVFLYSLGAASIELMNFMSASKIPYMEAVGGVVDGYSSLMTDIRPTELLAFLGEYTNVQEAGRVATGVLLNGMDVIFRVSLMFTITLYFLMDGSRLRKWAVASLYPNGRELAEGFLRAVDADIHMIFYGNIFTALLIAVLGGIVFIGLNQVAPDGMASPYPLLLGMVCGIASLVPMVGVALFWIPATCVLAAWAALNGTFVRDLWYISLFAASTAVVVDWVPNLVFKPRITARHIHPGLMLMAYILGPAAFGLAGLFLGPMILALAINYVKIVMPELRK